MVAITLCLYQSVSNMALEQFEEQQATGISAAYLDLKNKEFRGVYENPAIIPGTGTTRLLIRVTSPPEVTKTMNNILDMDNDPQAEVVWKAITRGVFEGTEGIRLWCNDRSTVGVADGQERRYKITQIKCVDLTFSEEYTYTCIMDVDVKTV